MNETYLSLIDEPCNLGESMRVLHYWNIDEWFTAMSIINIILCDEA